jgi:hypothetical protein
MRGSGWRAGVRLFSGWENHRIILGICPEKQESAFGGGVKKFSSIAGNFLMDQIRVENRCADSINFFLRERKPPRMISQFTTI